MGGASATPGHGLAGIEERLRGLGGTVEVRSPAGGPPIVLAHLPLRPCRVRSLGLLAWGRARARGGCR